VLVEHVPDPPALHQPPPDGDRLGAGQALAGDQPLHRLAADEAAPVQAQQVAAVRIPQVNTAVPMTFLHKGKQYIVFAYGAGANTGLTALALPAAPSGGARNGGAGGTR